MADDRSYPDPDAITAEEEAHDSRISAKMYLFLSRMVQAAKEEEQIDDERVIDLMLCSAVQFYVEHVSTNPHDVGVFCRAIAEEALKGSEGDVALH